MMKVNIYTSAKTTAPFFHTNNISSARKLFELEVSQYFVKSSPRCVSAVSQILKTSNINRNPDQETVMQEIDFAGFLKDVVDAVSNLPLV